MHYYCHISFASAILGPHDETAVFMTLLGMAQPESGQENNCFASAILGAHDETVFGHQRLSDTW
jgi:hypothetical protein